MAGWGGVHPLEPCVVFNELQGGPLLGVPLQHLDNKAVQRRARVTQPLPPKALFPPSQSTPLQNPQGRRQSRGEMGPWKGIVVPNGESLLLIPGPPMFLCSAESLHGSKVSQGRQKSPQQSTQPGDLFPSTIEQLDQNNNPNRPCAPKPQRLCG